MELLGRGAAWRAVGTGDIRVFCRRKKGAWEALPYDDVVSIGVADNRVGLVRHGHLLTLLQYARESMVNRVRDMSVPTRTIVFGADAAYVATRDYRGFSIADSGEIRPLAGLPSAVHIGADPTARHVCATDRAGALRCSGQNQAEARATQPIALALR